MLTSAVIDRCMFAAMGHGAAARGGRAVAPCAHLVLGAQCDALSTLLRQDRWDGHLGYQLAVEGTELAHLTAERGVSQTALVEHLRDAVDALAVEYEDMANASLGASDQERVRSALTRKRR